MPQLFILCPNTDQEVYTGLNMDWFDVDAYDLGEMSLECPNCSETHKWNQKDARLRSDGGG